MFSIVCFSETWPKDEKVNEKPLYQQEGYNLFHQNRKHKNGGGVAIFVKNSYSGIHILLKIEIILVLI